MENFGGEESTSAVAGVDMATPNGDRPRRSRKYGRGGNYQQAAGGQQEVGGGRGEKRNWKGIIISLFVILIVFGFVILAIILSAEEETALNYVRMSDITEQKWKLVLAPDAKWNGDTLVFKDDYNNVQMWLPDDKNPKTIISNITLMENGVEEYRVSRDGKFAIFIYDKTIRNSHSYFASYTIFDIFNRTSVRLRHNNNNEGDDGGEIEYVEFGRRPNDVIYVHNGDIYYLPTAQDSDTRVRITGSAGSERDSKIVNGIPDWIYEEEILKSNVAHWWSNNAMFLAYAQFNDSEVMQSYTTTYTKRKAANLNLLKYPQSEYYSCPKTGTPLPQVEVKVYDLDKQITISVPKPKNEKMSIFQSLWWSEDNGNLFIKWSNRPQNHVILQSCHVTNQVITCRDNLTTIQAPDRQHWIPNLNEAGIGANEEGSKFFWIEPQHQGKNGFFRHVAFVDTTQTQVRSKFVTSGSSWEVERIVKLDGEKRLFFLARRRRSGKGSNRHLYRIDLQTPDSSPRCVTCSNDVIANCSYFDAQFSRSAARLLLRCLGPTLPRSLVIGLKEDGSVDGEDWRPIGYYDEKEEERLKPGRSLFDYRYGTVQTDFYDIHYQLVVPISSSGKLGLVFEVADVEVENARSEYRIEFAEFLSSHSNIVVVRFDGAGSAMRGEQVLHHVTQDPGGAVMRDIDVLLEHIEKELEDYHITGVAVMGKHFGGHVAVLAAQQQQITCAVAISPIVDWEAHTSVSSEKLLGPIETSSRNYQQNNLLYNMKNIGEDKLLVFHGLKERVVHHQQSVALHQASLMHDEPRDIQMHYYADHASNEVMRDMWSKSYSFLHHCLSSKKIRS